MPCLADVEMRELAIEDLSVDAGLLFDEEDLRALHDARLCAREMGQSNTPDTFRDRADPYAPTYWVYAICNPDGTPFYVGQTHCLEQRWQQHRRSINMLPELRERLADRANRPHDTVLMFRRIRRIAKYLGEGTGPVFRQLGEAWSREEALALETTWVHRMTARGHELLNPGEHRAIPKRYVSHRRYERRYQVEVVRADQR
ncbi:GIY-YIG catalytic domain-containing protein [Aureimonas jatrophae]|uniref:GIY-YIG catalytic domain-containing protein n=2 Tax=Aureimonas jatrophae TaxID=1166073 RepID=A0A1H0N0R2_9HYPH|nr:GIY-YIG catalytic domain-containing protein [Aureimonas jatrophae]